jgi:hypothetical protein
MPIIIALILALMATNATAGKRVTCTSSTSGSGTTTTRCR